MRWFGCIYANRRACSSFALSQGNLVVTFGHRYDARHQEQIRCKMQHAQALQTSITAQSAAQGADARTQLGGQLVQYRWMSKKATYIQDRAGRHSHEYGQAGLSCELRPSARYGVTCLLSLWQNLPCSLRQHAWLRHTTFTLHARLAADRSVNGSNLQQTLKRVGPTQVLLHLVKVQLFGARAPHATCN